MGSRVKVALLLLAATAGLGIGFSGEPIISAAQAAPANRQATVEDLAGKLSSLFVDPEVGGKYAAMLRANAKSGKYASIADDKVFAKSSRTICRRFRSTVI